MYLFNISYWFYLSFFILFAYKFEYLHHRSASQFLFYRLETKFAFIIVWISFYTTCLFRFTSKLYMTIKVFSPGNFSIGNQYLIFPNQSSKVQKRPVNGFRSTMQRGRRRQSICHRRHDLAYRPPLNLTPPPQPNFNFQFPPF